jgi:upstream-binding transcription factor
MSMTLEIVAQRVTTLESQMSELSAKMEELVKVVSKKEKKEKKEKKAKKDAASSEDEEKPKKKRVSGYILFSNANRDDVKEKLVEGDEKPKNTEVMKELAKLWKALGDDEKEVWNAKAKELKDDA